MEAIVDAQSVFRAICLILNPKIGVSTPLSMIDDAKQLYERAEDTKSDHFFTMVGMAVKGKAMIAKSLQDILKWEKEWKLHGPAIQSHMKKFEELGNASDLLAALPPAVETFEKYSVTLPSSATNTFRDSISAAVKKGAQIVLSMQNPPLELVQQASNTIVAVSRVAPLDTEVAIFQQSVGEKIKKYTDVAKAQNLTVMLKKASDNNYDEPTALELQSSLDALGVNHLPGLDDDTKVCLNNMAEAVLRKVGMSIEENAGSPKTDSYKMLLGLRNSSLLGIGSSHAAAIGKASSALSALAFVMVCFERVKGLDMNNDVILERWAEVEACMRAMARAWLNFSALRTASHAAGAELHVTTGFLDDTEKFFQKRALEVLNIFKAGGLIRIQRAQAIFDNTMKPEEAGVDWRDAAKECASFAELADIAQQTIMQQNRTTIQNTSQDIADLAQAFNSFTAGVQLAEVGPWEDVVALAKSLQLASVQIKLIQCYTTTESKAVRRSATKAAQDELVAAGGITADDMPPALNKAMKDAVRLQPIA